MKPPPANLPEVTRLVGTAGGVCAVAAATGVSPRSINRWLSGDLPCPEELLPMLRAMAQLRTAEPFHHRLRKARVARGLTQAQAAAAISPLLSAATLQTWELGTKVPPEWTMAWVLGQVEKSGEKTK